MFTDVGPYLLALLAILIVVYGIGFALSRALLKHLQLHTFQSFFLQVFLGVVVCVIVYAAVKSGFQTINLLLLPMLGMLYFESKRINVPLVNPLNRVSAWYPPVVAAIAALVFFGVRSILVYQGGEVPFVVANGADYTQHALISEALASIGVENKFAPESLLSEQFRAIVPYHYFDLWLNALVASISGLNHYLVLELVTYPLFLTLGVLGFLALWETQHKPALWVYVIALVFIGFGGLHFQIYNSVAYISKANYRMMHFGETLYIPKLFYYFPFAFAFVSLLIKRYYLPAFIVLACLSIVYFSALVLFALPAAFIALNLVKPIWAERKEVFRLAAYLAVPLVLWVVFFKLFGQSIEGTRDEFSLKLFDMASLRTRINILGLSTIQAGVMYFPLVLGFVFMAIGVGKKYFWNKDVLLIVGAAVVTFYAGLGAWVIAFENIDGMQLMGNNMPVFNALLLALFVWLWKGVGQLNSKFPFYAGALLIIVLTLYVDITIARRMPTQKKSYAAKHSNEFLMQVSQKFTDAEEPLVGVFLKGDEEYNHHEYWPAHRISQAFRLIDPLILMPQYSSTIHFSIFDMPISTEPIAKAREENSFKGLLFNMYVEDQKKKGQFVDIEQSQVDFIREHQIKYVFATASAIRPAWLEELKTSEITDTKSGVSFISIDPKK